MTESAIFSHLEYLQGSEPWGGVLDAGTGRHSLEWISSLNSSRWTAVTADAERARKLEREFLDRMRPWDRVIGGNWADEALLHGESFDVVLADYLLGSIDGHAPYFQDRLFERLRRHVGGRLYVVGLEPYPRTAETPGGRIILEIVRLRDACILLAGDRCFREYPREWTIRRLESSGFTVEESRVFPCRYGHKFIDEQLEVCELKLPFFSSRDLAQSFSGRIHELRQRAFASFDPPGGIAFGEDYVILARPGKAR
jgi:hypothetical protein